MADVLVRNSLNPSKVVKVSVTFRQQILKDNDGEPVWLIEAATPELDSTTGERIPSEYIHVRSLDNLDAEIEKAVSTIASKIDWSPRIPDAEAPYIDSVSPTNYLVDIDSDIFFTLKEDLPSAGIDIDSIKMTINGIDVSSDLLIKGDPYEYRISWSPPARIRN